MFSNLFSTSNLAEIINSKRSNLLITMMPQTQINNKRETSFMRAFVFRAIETVVPTIRWSVSELHPNELTSTFYSDCKQPIMGTCSIRTPVQRTIQCTWEDLPCPEVGLYIVTLRTKEGHTNEQAYATTTQVEFSGSHIRVGVPYTVLVE